MTTYFSSPDYTSRGSDGTEGGLPERKRHPRVVLRHQLSQPQTAYSSCTLPANAGKTKAKFLNLRDSVKKSPTKSTAKVTVPGERFPGRAELLRAELLFDKVREVIKQRRTFGRTFQSLPCRVGMMSPCLDHLYRSQVLVCPIAFHFYSVVGRESTVAKISQIFLSEYLSICPLFENS